MYWSSPVSLANVLTFSCVVSTVAYAEHRANSLAQPGKTLDDERLPRVTRCGIDTH